jgi:hypothetical protein
VIDAGDCRQAWCHTGSQHYLVVTRQLHGADSATQPHVDAVLAQHRRSAHYFDAVVAGFLGQLRAPREIRNGRLDAAAGQGARPKRIDRRLD